jgi:hypothetical protein
VLWGFIVAMMVAVFGLPCLLCMSTASWTTGLWKIKHGHGSALSALRTALGSAASAGNLQRVFELLRSGTQEDMNTLHRGVGTQVHTPLFWSIRFGHLDIANTLIDAGARVDLHSNFGGSALTMATTGGHVELALRLISGGADLQLAAVLDGHPDPLTPLEHAKRLGQLQIAAAIESAVLPRLEDLVASAKVTGDTAKIDDLDRSIGLAVAAIGTPETDPILIEARLTLSELRLGKVRSLLQSSAIVFVVVLAGACFGCASSYTPTHHPVRRHGGPLLRRGLRLRQLLLHRRAQRAQERQRLVNPR